VATLAIALAGWAVVRLAMSPKIDLVALRDFAPYGYSLLVPVVLVLRRRGDRMPAWVLLPAFTMHSVWLSAAEAWPSLSKHLPALGETRWLEIRGDFDAMVCSAAVVMSLLLVPRRKSGR